MKTDKTTATGFDSRLRDLMEEKGWTQEGIAETLRIRQATVSDWVNGKSVPQPRNLAQICDLFRVFEQWLLRGIGPRDRRGVRETYYTESRGKIREDAALYGAGAPDPGGAERLREALRRHNIASVQEFALLMEIDEETARWWLKNGVPLTSANLVAHRLGVREDWLLYGLGEIVEPRSAPDLQDRMNRIDRLQRAVNALLEVGSEEDLARMEKILMEATGTHSESLATGQEPQKRVTPIPKGKRREAA